MRTHKHGYIHSLANTKMHTDAEVAYMQTHFNTNTQTWLHTLTDKIQICTGANTLMFTQMLRNIHAFKHTP